MSGKHTKRKAVRPSVSSAPRATAPVAGAKKSATRSASPTTSRAAASKGQRPSSAPSRKEKPVRGLSSSWLLVPLTAVCSLVVASVMAFGNPVLWKTAEQSVADQYAEGTDKDDYQFIDEVVGDEGNAADLVCLGEYKAISQEDDADRAANIELAAQELDGAEIKPGDTLSVNDLFGDTSEDERYKVTSVVNGTTIEPGRGGGVCQVSTALYIAALKANLEIVERYPHTIVCDYAPIGLDATLAYGQKDLRIKNNTEQSMFVRATALGQTVDVKIYGAKGTEGESTDATSKITDRFDVPASEVYDDPALLGLDPDDPVTYYVAESHRVLYRDGVMVSNTLLATDTYQVSVQSDVFVGEGGVDPSK